MLAGLNSPASNLVEKTSYCFNTMSRIETMKNAIMQTEKLVNKTKESVEIELGKMLKNGRVAADLQKLNIKIKMLREQLDKERSELELLKRKSLSFGKPNSSSGPSHCASVANKLSHNLSHSSCNNLNHHPVEQTDRRPRNHSSHQLSNGRSDCLSHSSYQLPNSLPNNLTEHLLSSGVNQQFDNLSIFPNNSTSNLPKSLSLSNQPISSPTLNSHSPIVRSPSVNALFDEEEQQLVLFDADSMERDKKLLSKIESEIAIKADLLKQINESLLFVERKLITELHQIFPIQESPDGMYTILGLQLPDLTDPLDENNDQIKISLGYCCQLLITIGKVFDIPLKHEILFSGSQSWIMNETENPRLKDKKYPLFPNRDKSKFNIAIYLLNENIAQISHYFKLQSDNKKLSSNLFSLLNNKLLLKQAELDGA